MDTELLKAGLWGLIAACVLLLVANRLFGIRIEARWAAVVSLIFMMGSSVTSGAGGFMEFYNAPQINRIAMAFLAASCAIVAVAFRRHWVVSVPAVVFSAYFSTMTTFSTQTWEGARQEQGLAVSVETVAGNRVEERASVRRSLQLEQDRLSVALTEQARAREALVRIEAEMREDPEAQRLSSSLAQWRALNRRGHTADPADIRSLQIEYAESPEIRAGGIDGSWGDQTAALVERLILQGEARYKAIAAGRAADKREEQRALSVAMTTEAAVAARIEELEARLGTLGDRVEAVAAQVNASEFAGHFATMKAWFWSMVWPDAGKLAPAFFIGAGLSVFMDLVAIVAAMVNEENRARDGRLRHLPIRAPRRWVGFRRLGSWAGTWFAAGSAGLEARRVEEEERRGWMMERLNRLYRRMKEGAPEPAPEAQTALTAAWRPPMDQRRASFDADAIVNDIRAGGSQPAGAHGGRRDAQARPRLDGEGRIVADQGLPKIRPGEVGTPRGASIRKG